METLIHNEIHFFFSLDIFFFFFFFCDTISRGFCFCSAVCSDQLLLYPLED